MDFKCIPMECLQMAYFVITNYKHKELIAKMENKDKQGHPLVSNVRMYLFDIASEHIPSMSIKKPFYRLISLLVLNKWILPAFTRVQANEPNALKDPWCIICNLFKPATHSWTHSTVLPGFLETNWGLFYIWIKM